jgi:ElaB/YqjD/DUF883 family membrane-anchored ribosome-binding protein
MTEREPTTAKTGQQAGVEPAEATAGDTVEAPAGEADVRAQMKARVEERTAGLRARRAELRQRQEELKARVAEARGRASEATPEDAKRTASRVGETAKQRPFPAIGIAFAAGVLLGWLIGRP